jgi:hypothetical protein
VAQDRAHFWAVVSAVIEKLVSLQRRGMQAYSASDELLAFVQEAPCFLVLANTDKKSCTTCFRQNITGEKQGTRVHVRLPGKNCTAPSGTRFGGVLTSFKTKYLGNAVTLLYSFRAP